MKNKKTETWVLNYWLKNIRKFTIDNFQCYDICESKQSKLLNFRDILWIYEYFSVKTYRFVEFAAQCCSICFLIISFDKIEILFHSIYFWKLSTKIDKIQSNNYKAIRRVDILYLEVFNYLFVCLNPHKNHIKLSSFEITTSCVSKSTLLIIFDFRNLSWIICIVFAFKHS